MQFSEQWLRTWINPDINTQALADRLTLAGLEVDAIDPACAEFSGVVVGEVKSVDPHPNADKLRITQVYDGEQTHQVVCGAPNVRPGMRAPFAQLGANLPGGIKIKKTKLRGEASLGMLCSASELGLESNQDGLWALPDDAPVGRDLREWLKLDDAIITLGITPNRGDALSIAGLAQECTAIFDQPHRPPVIEPVPESSEHTHNARITAVDACPVYLTRAVRNLPAGKTTPIYIQERLRRSGIKSIEPVVDILNYVMLEWGQPLHAFDADKLSGDIEVRYARSGEKLIALGEQTLELSEDCLVIADEHEPIALAGIIGSQPSAVDSNTRHIVIESAHFVPEAIIGRARRYALNTDAAFRFERGVDPALPQQALARACELIHRYVGGEVGPVVTAKNSRAIPTPQPIKLDMDWASDRLGMAIPVAQAVNLLTRLGCTVEVNQALLTVTPPTRRFDLKIKEDLLEELARLIGFDHFRAPLTRMTPEVGVMPVVINPQAHMADFLTARGYFEAITYSFIDPEAHRHLHPQCEPIRLANPIASQMAVMRQSLW
ncbi:MAG TPA: phenylalanine--tRNA ligase subunit beta, partial [Halothiobacillaceae bacterium]|nr:phenylalanine--tRNA ligase subunit beta [Halothiobacillaceae bacterium]